MNNIFQLMLCGLGALNAAGCGHGDRTIAGFETYVRAFDVEAKNRTIGFDSNNFRIVFAGDDSQILTRSSVTIALCHYRDNEIEVNKNYFDGLTEDGRELVIFHELGHCALKQGHRTGTASIMNPRAPVGYGWPNTRDWYLNELFEHKSDVIRGGL